MFSALVRNARSTRRFDENRPIAKSILLELVDMARLSPSGGNKQPLRYKILHGPENCAKMFTCLSWAAALPDWPGPDEGERPTGYIIVLSEPHAGITPPVDLGIACQTIQLAAASHECGCCMLANIDRPRIRKWFEIPDKYVIRIVLALGRPNETIVLEECHSTDSTDYYRTRDGVHHVPKLTLDDILLT